MKFLKTTCVLAFLGLASLGQAQYASNHVDQAIMVKASTRDYVKFSVDRNYVGGDYFITDRSGVMVAIGKVRNADIEYYPERFDNHAAGM